MAYWTTLHSPTVCLQQYEAAPNILSYNTEEYEQSIVTVQGIEGTYLEGDTGNILIWQKDDLYFQITSKLDEEILVALADSVRK